MKTQSMTVGDFLTGAYKEKKKINWKPIKKVASTIVPLTLIPHITFAQESVPVGATQYLGEKTLETIAHALDPLVNLMVALSFPVCSVIIVGACFFFMLGKSERGWSGIQNAGLGYILIQIMPMLLNVLKDIGSAI